jgi:penicillin-binding protein 1C
VKSRTWSRRKRRIVGAAIVALVATAWVGWMALWQHVRDRVGEPSEALGDAWHHGHRVVDREGRILRELPSETGMRGRPLALEEIGPRLVSATLVSEDRDFYDHDGIDRAAILRAIEQNVRHGRFVSGASTVSQQLVKLLDSRGVPGQRTAELKLVEAARAQNLEARLDKPTILVEYMNRLPYGHGLVGPEAAAQAYFGVKATDLSWAQAALLAVLPRAPSWLDPYRHLHRAVLRQRALLQAMHDEGVLDDAALARALDEPLVLKPLAHAFEAPHLVDTLVAEGALARGTVTHTTIDLDLQRDVQGLVRTHLASLSGRGVGNAAVLVVDNQSGEVLAWIGSADFDDDAIAGQIDMVTSPRQPGSTLKPFVYAAAFAHGHTPAEMVADVPTEFVEAGGRVYAPANFDGSYLGPLSAREALATSLNVPVVRLAKELPEGELLGLLHRLGLRSLDLPAHHYGLSLALGTGEVELRELAAAYVALANGGVAVPLRVVAGAPAAEPVRVLDASIAAAVTDALADPLARVRLTGGRASPFDIGYPLALKTGTSSGYRDAWTVGYAKERTVAVWLGNADGSAMHGVTGAGGAGPLFADVMRRAMDDVPTRAPLWSEELLEVADVCPLSGLRAGAGCPASVQRRFAPAAIPDEPCDVHVLAEKHAHGKWRCDADATTLVARMPVEFNAWLDTLAPGAPGRDPHGTPWVKHGDVVGCGDVHAGPPVLRMVTPTTGAVFLPGTSWREHTVELRAELAGEANVREVEFVVDGAIVAKSKAPFVARVAIGPGDHEVIARPRDRKAAVVMEGAKFSVR